MSGRRADPGWTGPALELIRQRYFGGPVSRPHGTAAWTRATGAAMVERLGPALAEAVEVCGSQVPQNCWAALTASRLENTLEVEAQQRLLGELKSEFEDAGVEPAVFKGLAVSRHYPAPDLRVLSDLDLLIAPGWFLEIDRRLRALGFRRWSEPGAGSHRYAVMYTRSDRNARQVVIDVHPGWHEIALSPDGETLWIGSRRVRPERARFAGSIWNVLPAAVDLYLVASHAVLHNPRTLSVYLDTGLLLQALGPAALERVWELARANGRCRHLRHAFGIAADLFGLDLADTYQSRIGRLGVPAALRLGYLGPGRRYLPSSLVLELAWRRGWRRKIAFARWVLGHGSRGSSGADRARSRAGFPLARTLRGMRWLRGFTLRYRSPGSIALRS